MIDALRAARADIARHLATADPDRVATGRAAELVELFAEIERLGAAGKVVYAARAARSTTWRDDGARSAAEWMAGKTRTSLGDAVATLEAAEALASLPATAAALRSGALSAPQVKAITTAAAAHPDAEAELVEAAANSTLRGLKERCAAVAARVGSARAENDRYKAIKASRYVRHWADPDGAFRLDARLTPDAGARLVGALGAEADARFAAARRSGERESPVAYAADALVDLVTGAASGPKGQAGSSGARATVSIRVDAAALRRGFTKRGETCEIPGIGPVPVAVATRELSDAFVKLLATDGVDVLSVCHVGRSVPAHVQSALEERDRRCVVPGCERAGGLENHHWDVPYAECGTSTLAGLARVCSWHHDLITYDGFTLGGGPGRWEWHAAPGEALFDSS